MAVPGYTEIRELGHGGTGRVMLAVRDSDALPVAIKHLSEPLREDAEFVARFRAEAGVIGEIDSPHTARLLDYVEAGGTAAIVMELVDGVTLRRLIAQEGGTGVEAALAVLKGALLGLAEAHRRGVVHRDFKPENVIITTDGDSKLVDFGVAARFGETGALAGTPSYMAPEQWDDAPAGPASDVYAAAVVFFECLTGRRPFTAANLAALAFQHQHMPPPLEQVDGRLRGLVEHGLAKDPAHRPASAEAFLAELEEVARRTYGAGWELRGRSGLAVLTLPFTALLPSAGSGVESVAESGAGTATSVVRSSFGPPARLAVTGGLVLATAAAVASTFVIWSGSPSPDSGTALPPVVAEGTSLTTAPASPEPVTPVPSGSGTVSPPYTAGPSGYPTAPPASSAPPSTQPPAQPSTQPATAPPSTTRPGTRPPRPTGGPPASEAPPTRSSPPSARPPAKPPATRPADDPPATRPPATSAPPTGAPATSAPATKPPATPPPAKTHKPLLSVSLGVSLGGSLLGRDGGGLLDADIDLGLGSSLLGILAVPGSALLGGRLAVRRARKSRHREKS
ncbi:protein kinase [Nonomuraea spiralis]|uniref:non-specific serine/threonine protein kinase n=1 Tax=Nonomuraea spiralis TaxID=46182 RepID=A0ABV5I670_9ACTN|nr:serine/threonine-protein kinase [Nonomuraea spiralis]GGS63832.1 hypothetical protein GCM10010176_002700 [Nonomuraea spiralis]